MIDIIIHNINNEHNCKKKNNLKIKWKKCVLKIKYKKKKQI